MNAVRHRAVLVGASGGIGSAIARSLAPACDRLLLVGRDRNRLAALEAELASKDAVASLAADIATHAGRRAVADAAASQPCDLLINCAGTGELTWFSEQTDDAIENIIDTNLVAPMLVVHALLPVLASAPKATIVNVGSIFGYLGYPGCATYSASKFGLRGFTEALRRELAGSSIRVMHLAPRSTRTSLNSDAMYALNAGLGVAVDDRLEGHLEAAVAGGEPPRTAVVRAFGQMELQVGQLVRLAVEEQDVLARGRGVAEPVADIEAERLAVD